MSRWQVAARLARREVRRHWVRSLLVVAIVAIPLGAAQAAAINGAVEVRGSSRPLDEGAGFDTYGGSDESVGFDPRLGRPSEISPPGTESGRPVERVAVGFSIRDWTHAAAAHRRGPDGLTPLTTIALVDDDVEPIEGRLPRTRHEAVISPALARTAGLDVGDDLRMIASQVDLTVVGVVDHPFDEANAAVGPLADGEEDWAAAALARIRDVDQDQVQVWAEMYELFWWDDTAGPGTAVLARSPAPGAAELVVAAVAGTIAVGFVAVTSSAAFAISARRQVRQLGILAAAGAGPGDLTRAVLLQGSTLGLVGAIVATVLVYAGRAVAVTWVLRPAAEDGPIIPLAPASVLGLAVLGVVAGTLAALVPALTASRIPVLAALAGRRPVPRRRMWSPWVGGVVLAGGLVTLGAVTVASTHDAAPAGGETAAGAALAVLAVMGGATALSPAVIAAVARLTGRARGTARLAGRSLSRDRMRSSAVVAASAVALGLPVVLILWQAHDAGTNWYGPFDGATEEAWQHVQDARTTTETITTYGPAGALDDVDGQLREILGPGTVGARTIDVQGEGTGPSGAPATAVDPEELRRATGDDAVADLLAQ
ncbi:MAG TPA: ABC transporter permease, partial [Iamia sp.]|nr:ABC transporter permease [Iamia sp.]